LVVSLDDVADRGSRRGLTSIESVSEFNSIPGVVVIAGECFSRNSSTRPPECKRMLAQYEGESNLLTLLHDTVHSRT
jgi:hypothetical protein